MSSLRDKLKGYGTGAAKKAAPQPEKKEADCYRVFDRTDRIRYQLPELFRAGSLEAASGLKTDRDIPLERVLFLDTETTGLSGGAGTIAFLTGMGYFEGDAFIVEQDLMRDYDEEPAMLKRIAELLERTDLLVTFNGRTFDMPLLESRMIMNGRRLKSGIPHLDLLHASRAVWKLRLKRCSLSALEQAVLGIVRQDDMPGSEVPKTYFEYLKTGHFPLIEPILEHNCQDIRSLPLLMSRLIRFFTAPDQAEDQRDIYSAGRALEKRGYTEQARRCYRAADAGTVSALSRLKLADSHRRTMEFGEAATIYERMIGTGQGNVNVLTRLAILYEHRLNRLPDALRLTERAMLLTNDNDEMAALDKRRSRLIKRMERMRSSYGTDGHDQGKESAGVAPEGRSRPGAGRL